MEFIIGAFHHIYFIAEKDPVRSKPAKPNYHLEDILVLNVQLLSSLQHLLYIQTRLQANVRLPPILGLFKNSFRNSLAWLERPPLGGIRKFMHFIYCTGSFGMQEVSRLARGIWWMHFVLNSISLERSNVKDIAGRNQRVPQAKKSRVHKFNMSTKFFRLFFLSARIHGSWQ